MFFRSEKSPLLAAVLILVGLFQLTSGLTYAGAAKREASTVGLLSSVQCGRTCTYAYVFTVNDVKISDDSSTCKTPLTSRGCRKGAPVRVYYDPEDLSTNFLEEFHLAARGRIFFGTWMISCGLLLICLYFILNKFGKNSEDAGDPDQDNGNSDVAGESDVLHVTPQ